MKKNHFSLFIVLLAIFSCNSPINVSDDFEAPTLNRVWSAERMEQRSFEIQSEVVRKGKHAAKITLRTGDMVEEANDTSAASERDELQEADDLYSIEEKKYEYHFSLFIPDSFPIVRTRLIIAQWKQKCPAKSCSDDSPVLAIRFQSGKLMITLNTDPGRQKLYEQSENVRNQWLDFKFQIRFSQRDSGEVTAYLNQKSIINYEGVTSYSEKRGYHQSHNTYYFKMGLYRDRMQELMTIYIDDYQKKEVVVPK